MTVTYHVTATQSTRSPHSYACILMVQYVANLPHKDLAEVYALEPPAFFQSHRSLFNCAEKKMWGYKHSQGQPMG